MKKVGVLVLLPLLLLTILLGGCSSSGAAGAAKDQVGRYTKQGNSTDYFELRADGTFDSIDHGRSMAGTYTVSGSTLTIIVPGRGSATGALQPGTITDNEGQVWKK